MTDDDRLPLAFERIAPDGQHAHPALSHADAVTAHRARFFRPNLCPSS
ncbi:MAG: hypothetical protein IPK17_37270 [Chloroflexi bacterium]|nr:hypothetical protein [Chloroflexota bacterium]